MVDENAPNPPAPDLSECDRWPYPMRIYAARLLWQIVQATLWRVAWVRVPQIRRAILKCFGAKIGQRLLINGSTRIEMPWDFRIGKFCAIGDRVYLYNLGGLDIGDHTVISQDAYLCGGTHDYRDPAYPLLRQKIKVGNYVWIAAGAFIGPGVTIGDGAVIGARAVVMRDVEPWTVVAGNPAKVIRKREMAAAGANP